MEKKTNRLGNTDKPKKSIQKKLSPDEIDEKLIGYTKVNNLTELALGDHVRYFTKDPNTGEFLFRLGGTINKADFDKGYLIISNGKYSWSAQLKNSIFFKKLSLEDFKKQMEKEYSKKYSKKIKKLESENKRLKETLKEIKSEMKK